jgi:predicted PurR-regulated permease PerM
MQDDMIDITDRYERLLKILRNFTKIVIIAAIFTFIIVILTDIYADRIYGLIAFFGIFCCLYIAAFIYLKKEIFEQITAIENTQGMPEPLQKMVQQLKTRKILLPWLWGFRNRK